MYPTINTIELEDGSYVEYEFVYVHNKRSLFVIKYFYLKDNQEMLHRVGDLPNAYVYNNDGTLSVETYYKHNKLHREGFKPAFIHYIDDFVSEKEYWLNNKRYSEVEAKRIHILKHIKENS